GLILFRISISGIILNCISTTIFFFFSLIIWLPPISTLFPYTTLFRSFDFVELDRLEPLEELIVAPNDPAFKRDVSILQQPRHFRSEEHTSELQSRGHLVCRLLLEKKKDITVGVNYSPITHAFLHHFK